MVSRLADLENIVAVKNSPPWPHTLETLRLAGDRIIVSHPDERNWYRLMGEIGIRVYMSSASPFLIQKPCHTLIKDYTALVLSGQVEEPARLAASLDPAPPVFEQRRRE